LLVSTDVQSLLAAANGRFQPAHDERGKADENTNERATQSSTNASNTTNNKYHTYIDRARLTKRRKPPEYVGYAANVDSNIDSQGQSAKFVDFPANITLIDNELAGKTNVIEIPEFHEFYDNEWKMGEDGVWRAACHELNCVRGSKCVPDALRDGRARCQCPLGTSGLRCERCTSAKIFTRTYDCISYIIHVKIDAYDKKQCRLQAA